MKTQKSTNSNRRLLLMVPVIASMAFAACSDLPGQTESRQAVNLQSGAVGKAQASDYLTIGKRDYNPETRSFDRPWPFGPEASAQ
jgi:hypothetical protein